MIFQVPLGILPLNENKTDDMIDIMTHIHQYVPCYVHEEERDIQGEMVKVAKESVYPILFGGDQLTASRARSAKKAKVNSVKSSLGWKA